MGGKTAIAAFGLTLLCASPCWAGTTGNGWAQRAGQPPQTQTYYTFCYAGDPAVAYFSPVIVEHSAAPNSELGGPFADYLAATYGKPYSGPCIRSDTPADASREKKTRETSYPTRHIVEVEWTGAQ